MSKEMAPNYCICNVKILRLRKFNLLLSGILVGAHVQQEKKINYIPLLFIKDLLWCQVYV